MSEESGRENDDLAAIESMYSEQGLGSKTNNQVVAAAVKSAWDALSVLERNGTLDGHKILMNEGLRLPDVMTAMREAQNELNKRLRDSILIINNAFSFIRSLGGKPAVVFYEPSQVIHGLELKSMGLRPFLEAWNTDYVPHSLVLDTDGDRIVIKIKPKTLMKLWYDSDSRKAFNGMVLDPSTKDERVNDNLNLWRGFAVKPRKGDWRLMNEHIRLVLAAGDEASYNYIVRWMAWMVQNPAEVAETAICFVGDQGTGKSTAGKWLLTIFGIHALRPSSSRQVTGNFNSQLQDKVFILMDEAMNPDSRAAENIMKGFVTDQVLTVEHKFRDATPMLNRMKFMIISNHDHFLKISENDRRFAAFRVSNAHRQDDAYFQALYAEAGQGGIEAMLHDLLEMELGEWHPRKNIPETKERRRQQVYSLSTDEFKGIWHYILDNGIWPQTDFKQANFDAGKIESTDLIAWCAKHFPKVTINSMDLSHKLGGEIGYRKDDKKPRGYIIGSLKDARRRWMGLDEDRKGRDAVRRACGWEELEGWEDDEWEFAPQDRF